ncbi:polyadenylate-binding protein-interacting protein 1 [Exaiptasia diaphana]|uniref:MIF4G domain-containing protein n=1 Tax=Exaiptasia diaphana TaxID=2652724 RepID=A0A913XYZ7_EXADI|nr:polyadenylate-binding protein-interacting protein 1 [Exaiptasia diaphana]KXJ23989.1 Polyadenylate-binding protein-interacting protein 1 [Exaiptasia diaphana]
MSSRFPGRGINAHQYIPLRKPGEKRQETVQDGGSINSVSNALSKMHLNVNAPEFVPRFTIPAKSVEPVQQPPDIQVVNYVKEALDRLTYSPGEFDLVVDDLALAWKARIHDMGTLNEVARVIIEQSILQKNFTYTGARLCDLIAKRKDLNDVQETKSFRTIFLQRCGEEHKQREELLQSPNRVSRVHGFAMFLAELYTTFRMNSEPLDILRKKLIEMLMTLIKHGSDDSLLYAGRILKLTGSLLDDPKFVNNQLTVEVDEIFKEIQTLITASPNLGSSIKVFLESVINLRKLNWGRENTPPVSNTSLSAEAPIFQSSNQAAYQNDQDGYYQDDYYSYDIDDITPVSNPDQWNDYCGDDSPDEINYYQNDNGDEGEDDDYAFTEEMRRDFDKFMSEQHPPPTG